LSSFLGVPAGATMIDLSLSSPKSSDL